MARPISADYDEKRLTILRAAGRVFASEGVARASMVQVAEAAGISKATIYHYHASKDGLLFEILDHHLSDLRDRVLAVEMNADVPESALYHLVQEILAAYEGMAHAHVIKEEGVGLLSPEQQKVLRGYEDEVTHRVSAVLSQIAPEVFEDTAKLRATTMSVLAMLQGYRGWAQGADAEARAAYAELVADLTLGGVNAL